MTTNVDCCLDCRDGCNDDGDDSEVENAGHFGGSRFVDCKMVLLFIVGCKKVLLFIVKRSGELKMLESNDEDVIFPLNSVF